MVEMEVSAKNVHREMIQAYQAQGLNFFGLRDLKLERNEVCHAFKNITEDHLPDRILLDSQEVALVPGESIEVQKLRITLGQLLEASQKLYGITQQSPSSFAKLD